MAISQNFPNTRPSLNLNFARSKTLDPRITFIRTQTGSEASYVDESGIIRYASADEPRFDHDPETGKCLGLMIEEQRTNLIAYSTYHAGDGSNSDFRWLPLNGASTSSTTETAPDGTSTAWRWDGNSGSGAIARVYLGPDTFTANGSDSYTISFYAKLISGTTKSSTLIFDLQDTQLLTFYESNLVTGEWKRIVITGTPASGTYTFMDLVNNNTTDYVIDFWGLQIEKDKDVSSYIPTSGSTVTRNADNVWMTDISDFFNPSQGTSVIRYSPRFDTNANSRYRALFSFRDTSTGYRISIAGNEHQMYFPSTGTLMDYYTYSGPSFIRNNLETNVVSYGSTYFRLYLNDQQPWSSSHPSYGAGKIEELIPHKSPSTGITTSNFTTLSFGYSHANTSNSKLNCNIESFTYYPSEVGVENIKTFTRDQ
tara:strand:+ start:13 stop:1287 length:1275 start_codon:yes stop_codon:yes gene_type:complete